MPRLSGEGALTESDRGAVPLLVAAGLAGCLWATLANNSPVPELRRPQQYRMPVGIWLPGGASSLPVLTDTTSR